MRTLKVKQIAVVHDEDSGGDTVYALVENGTMWELYEGCWSKLPDITIDEGAEPPSKTVQKESQK